MKDQEKIQIIGNRETHLFQTVKGPRDGGRGNGVAGKEKVKKKKKKSRCFVWAPTYHNLCNHYVLQACALFHINIKQNLSDTLCYCLNKFIHAQTS